MAVVATFSHTITLDDSLRVWALGSNKYGKLGLGDKEFIDKPTIIEDLPGIVCISGGPIHCVCVDTSGNVWSFGNHMFGRLGIDTDEPITKPRCIENLSDIKSVHSGLSHNICVSYSGKVFSFGSNFRGQLGLGHCDNVTIPTLIPSLDNIVMAAAGDNHSLFLNSNGEVFSCGNNFENQLGYNLSGKDCFTTVPTKIIDLPKIVSIASGANHSIVLSEDGEVYAFGSNSHCQLGYTKFESKVQPVLVNYSNVTCSIKGITCGKNHSVLIADDNSVWTFGDVDKNSIPSKVNVENAVCVSSGGNFIVILDNYDKIVTIGEPIVPPGSSIDNIHHFKVLNGSEYSNIIGVKSNATKSARK